MGAEVFHGRVRDGIGCIILAMTTGPPSRILTTDEGCWIWMCVCWRQMVRGLVLRAAGGVAFMGQTLAGAALGYSGALSGD